MGEDTTDVPLIVDTDIGGDADDALALAAAARRVPALTVVMTNDETPDGVRARFARLLLDELARADVVTASGAVLSPDPTCVIDDLVPGGIPGQRTDIVEVFRETCSRTQGPLRWLGLGSMTNLARVVSEEPSLAARLRVIQMGGALAYRDPTRAEHNLRLDPGAVRTVLEAVREGILAVPVFVASEVTFTPRMEITASHPIYRTLSLAGRRAWPRLLTDHVDRWVDRCHPGSIQHDALTLTAALGLPFVECDLKRVAVDEIGRTTESDDGADVRWSVSADYDAFMVWLAVALDPETGSD